MSRFLVDTNVISELSRPRPDARVAAWMSARETIALSAVSVEEVEFGLSARPKESVRRVFEEILRECCVVYPVTLEIARAAGELRGSLRRRGITRSQSDMLIAATALVHGCVVVTRNVKDFEGCGVEVFNPWEF